MAQGTVDDLSRFSPARCLAVAMLGLAMSSGSVMAGAGQSGAVDLSQFVVPPDAIGADWTIASQQNETPLAGFSPPASSGYSVTYAQNPQSGASVALYAFPDHAGAVASLSDPYYYWGHGNTTLVPLNGLGDDQSFRAYGVGRGPTSGITFVDGPVVAYVRAEDDNATDTAGVDAVCDSLAAAEDGLLQSELNR